MHSGVFPREATKTESSILLQEARRAIDRGEAHYRDAANAIATVIEQGGVTQSGIATAVGKSVGWINALLQWRKNGFKEKSPFVAQAKASRTRRSRVQCTERGRRVANAANQSVLDDLKLALLEAEAAKLQAELARIDAEEARIIAKEALEKARRARKRAKRMKRKMNAYGSASASVAGSRKLDAATRERLVKVLGMLGSDQDGEVLAAGRAAEKLRRAANANWSNLIVRPA